MKPLDLKLVNRLAPYKVEYKSGEYIFETDYDIREPIPIFRRSLISSTSRLLCSVPISRRTETNPDCQRECQNNLFPFWFMICSTISLAWST